ncbi:MAG: hypothetical protein ABIF10_01750 [Candidatus Woesearchaeota archaeon]
MEGRVVRNPDSIDIYVSEGKPVGEPDIEKKIQIPMDYNSIKVGDSYEILQIENHYWTDFAGIKALCTELDFERLRGYEGDTINVYWLYIPELKNFVGITHAKNYVERKGDDHTFDGPFTPSAKHRERLAESGLDLTKMSP